MNKQQVFDIPRLATVTIVPAVIDPIEDTEEYKASVKAYHEAWDKALAGSDSKKRFRLQVSQEEARKRLAEKLDTIPEFPKSSGSPLRVEIRLSPDYQGDLNDTDNGSTTTDDGIWFMGSSRTKRLDRFMEVMSHHDYTGDGEPDCDEIIDAIEEVVKGSAPKPFVRPNSGWFDKLCMSIMPPAPDRHVVFGFDDLKPRFRWYHTVAAIPLFIAVIALVFGQIALLPFMHYSVISGIMAVSVALGFPGWAGLVALFALLFIGGNVRAYRDLKSGKEKKPDSGDSYSTNTIGFFNKAAVYEEQAWREGSESWSAWQRIRSCISFGAIHMANLIYPLAAILPLALGGGLFMYVYLRTLRRTGSRRAAVLQSSIWHRVYNRIALAAFALQLVLLLVLGVFTIFT